MIPGPSMSIADMLKTLDRTKSMQKLQSKPNIVTSEREVDWSKRKEEKHRLFVKYTQMLCVLALCSLLVIIIPLFLVAPSVGKSVFISLPPMLILVLSWMVPTWLFFYKKELLFSTTICAIPIRIIVAAVFSYIIYTYADGIIFNVFFIGMIWHWVLFAIPEMFMLHHFSKIR